MRSMSVLIVGANGFLGSRLMRGFRSEGARVAGTVRVSADLRMLEQCEIDETFLHTIASDWSNIGAILDTVRPNIVINTTTASFGTEGTAEVRSMIETNILYPAILLTEMLRRDISRFISCGSSWQAVAGVGYDPFNFYSATKQGCEAIIDGFVLSGLKATTLRLFDTYGPGDLRKKIVNLLIQTALSKGALDMSPGMQKIDLIYVDDVVAAFVASADALFDREWPGHAVHKISSGAPVPLRQVAETIGTILGQGPKINWGARPYRDREVMEPKSDLPTVPGWSYGTSLDDGIRACIDWQRVHSP